MPHTMVRKIDGALMNDKYEIISKETALDICIKCGENLILKPSIGTEGGRGIMFYNVGDDISKLKEFFIKNKNFIVQQIITQHKDLARLHKSSINTIRIMTLFFNGEIHALSSVVRIGVNGKRVDNVSSGGYACGINEDGSLKEYAFNGIGEKISKHPQGAIFKDCRIEHYAKCKDAAIKLSPMLSGFSKMVSWDFSIDSEGNPILIEVNLAFGELDFHQMNNGPIFGDLTDDVLKHVFSNNNC